MKPFGVNNPPKWHKVFSNSRERAFFVGSDSKSGLVRGKSGEGKTLTFRSIKMLASESGLTTKQVEEIIQKYQPSGIVVNNPKNPEQWGYWENVEAIEVPKSIGDTDKEDRVKKAGGTTLKSSANKHGGATPGAAVQGGPAGSPTAGGAVAPAPVAAPVPAAVP
jgi:hypothetical protein